MRWFQALMPREDRFFGYFIDHARLLLKGAEALRGILSGGEGVAEGCTAVMRYEDAADDVTREVLLAVRRTLITPFDRSDITSHDWSQYPIMRFTQVPESVAVHIIDRPGERFLGTGEAGQGPTTAAIANAIADATGARLRDLPLRADRIKAAIGV